MHKEHFKIDPIIIYSFFIDAPYFKYITTIKKELRAISRDKKSFRALLIYPLIIPLMVVMLSFCFDLIKDQEKDIYSFGSNYNLNMNNNNNNNNNENSEANSKISDLVNSEDTVFYNKKTIYRVKDEK